MKNLLKGIALVGIVAVLLATAVVSACGGGGEKETKTVTLGWLADQTGASSGAFEEVWMGMKDYVTEMEATDPIPGVQLKFEVYNTKLEYARAQQGYQWLMDKGMDLLLHYDPPEQAMLAATQADDQMPSLCFCADVETLQTDYLYAYSVDYINEGRAIVKYLIKDWWETKGMTTPIKVGALVMSDMQSGPQYWEGFKAEADANPGKIVLKQAQASRTQTGWAGEVGALKGQDAIIFTTVGPASASFLRDITAPNSGFQGVLAGTTISALAFWTLIADTVSLSELDGLVLPHAWALWTDETSYVANMSAMLEKYRPSQAATLKQGTTWESGWTLAHILATLVRNAADKVGSDKIDKAAMLDALEGLSLQIEGMPTISLAGSGGNHVFQPNLRMIKYNGTEDSWDNVTDFFYALP